MAPLLYAAFPRLLSIPMPLLNLLDAQLAYGLHPLLDRAALSIEPGERLGLIGRNGTGKSSLLSVITGEVALDDGELRMQDGLRVARVEQEPILPPAATLRDSLVERAKLDDMHDDRERWRIEARLVEHLHRFGLEADAPLDNASGGERKRAALALAFALDPELLLLDEPTNHLDIDGISLLETAIARSTQGGPAAIIVTHDRWFLDRVVTRIIELDRGMLRSYPGNFSTYETTKADQLASEALANRRFDKFWAQEEIWIRKGVQARRTRDEGRVRRLEALRVERSERRERIGNVKLNVDSGERSGKLVAELEGVNKSFGGRPIVKDLSLRIIRGDRIGLIGVNGAGKSTLIKLILGTLEADSGKIKLGTNVSVAYFDQMREQLDVERTVLETVSPGSDWVEVAGGKKHVMTYLADFLFSPRRAEAQVKMLSGGERNRLLLARLFARPANVLVLDEPTNDLDIESLELLEQTLQDYAGTLLLVSHDRVFLDNVVTQTIAAEGDGKWKEYVGGYSDWLRQRPTAAESAASTAAANPPAAPTPAPAAKKVKLSFKEQRELDGLPAELEALEVEQKALSAKMSSPDYFKQGGEVMRTDQKRADEIDALLVSKLERWEALEKKVKGTG